MCSFSVNRNGLLNNRIILSLFYFIFIIYTIMMFYFWAIVFDADPALGNINVNVYEFI